jgi:hypothetical protein
MDRTGAGASDRANGLSRVSARAERCTERFLERVKSEGSADPEAEEVRRYVESTYCTPFDRRGWVYEDGTLSIAAHTWLETSGKEVCQSAGLENIVTTMPCEKLDRGTRPTVIDCAMLHYVRRSEVRDYIERLRTPDVECDDGTPLEVLGAP